MKTLFTISLVVGMTTGWLLGDAITSNRACAASIAIRIDQGIGYGIPQAPSAAPWYGPRTGRNIAPTARVRRLPGGIEAPANGCSRPAFEAVSGPDKGACYAN